MNKQQILSLRKKISDIFFKDYEMMKIHRMYIEFYENWLEEEYKKDDYNQNEKYFINQFKQCFHNINKKDMEYHIFSSFRDFIYNDKLLIQISKFLL